MSTTTVLTVPAPTSANETTRRAFFAHHVVRNWTTSTVRSFAVSFLRKQGNKAVSPEIKVFLTSKVETDNRKGLVLALVEQELRNPVQPPPSPTEVAKQIMSDMEAARVAEQERLTMLAGTGRVLTPEDVTINVRRVEVTPSASLDEVEIARRALVKTIIESGLRTAIEVPADKRFARATGIFTPIPVTASPDQVHSMELAVHTARRFFAILQQDAEKA